jgi:nucleoside-diphosphate kinase
LEKTLIILKPDSVQRRLTGRIISRFEEKGLNIIGLKMMKIDEALAERLYSVHQGKHFYDKLIRFITSSPVVVMALEGKNVIDVARKLMGATFGSKAEAGTIRGDFAMSNSFNVVHGSDSAESVERELPLFFKAEELLKWDPADISWVYDFSGGEPE